MTYFVLRAGVRQRVDVLERDGHLTGDPPAKDLHVVFDVARGIRDQRPSTTRTAIE